MDILNADLNVQRIDNPYDIWIIDKFLKNKKRKKNVQKVTRSGAFCHVYTICNS